MAGESSKRTMTNKQTVETENSSDLEFLKTDKKNICKETVFEKREKVQNGLVIELLHLAKGDKQVFVKWFSQVVGVAPDSRQAKCFTQKYVLFHRLKEKHRKLKTSKKNIELNEFLQEVFSLKALLPPEQASYGNEIAVQTVQSSITESRVSVGESTEARKALAAIGHQVLESGRPSKSPQKRALQEYSCAVTKDLSQLRTKFEGQKRSFKATQNLLSKKLQRKDVQIENLKTKLSVSFKKSVSTDIEQSLKKREQAKSLHEKCKKAKSIAVTTAKKSLMLKLAEKYAHKNELLKRRLDLQNTMLKDLKAENENVKSENDDLRAQLQQERWVKTKMGGNKGYTTEMQELVMKVLDCDVPFEKVSAVVRHCMDFAGVKLSDYPSYGTVKNISDLRLLVAQEHLVEVLPSLANTTLQTDETPKNQEKYEVYALSARDEDDNECSLVLGLREMADKSSQTMMDKFVEIVEDLKSVAGDSAPVNRIVMNIRNFMADRAATERKFSDLLKMYREKVFSASNENWDELTDEQQSSMLKMFSFFCGLHLLTGFADSIALAIKDFEIMTAGGEKLGAEATVFFKSNKGEAGVVRLVRLACKAVGRGGCEKSGYQLAYRDYRRDIKGITASEFKPFKGNRFNILFHNAEILFFDWDLLIEFFEKRYTSDNQLLQVVLADLRVPLYRALCKVLGLVSKVVTAPLWRLLESKMHVLQMNKIYEKLLCWLDDMTENPTEFLLGESTPFSHEESPVNRDFIFEKLVEHNEELADHVYSGAKIILGCLAAVIRRLCQTNLPGGELSGLENCSSTIELTKSVPKHNKLPEHIFGLLDRILVDKPNASKIHLESKIMFLKNKTARWLDTKSENEKEQLILSLRKQLPSVQNMYKQRSIEIRKERIAQMEAKAAEKAARDAKRAEAMGQLIADVSDLGLWTTESQVDCMLGRISSETKKREQLSRQIRFRKDLLKQPVPSGHSKDIFQSSSKGKQKDSGTLREQLLVLIQAAGQLTPEAEAGTTAWLVGKKVKHLFTEEDGDKWWDGIVISSVPGFPQWFNIYYPEQEDPDDEEKVWTFRLLDDYAKGDLLVID